MLKLIGANVNIKDVKMGVGRFVKAKRKAENLTQEQLAERLAISRITIQNLEAGKNFTMDTLLKVLQHFNLLSGLHQLIVSEVDAAENIESLY
ncbi:MAG: helix-turn-helix domain-containing protein [Salibacteraceae bacterium]|nr:helix-turn-helix domain-containing protein [Salibacteraceae bacterium]MDP4685546.1 helix-turn-helix domain-containing protein [Salibacteraceae bacterium]MDP4762490.1 helix-turn-helix domain-containing protein [Salibacteraceae bacterium]MDP4933118.1 helix-turn-helix domain-containing protein [Salibacteraceae bacterium]MDP4964664.1 helix-turn-helix domain-containing protein [Salibacteraceae bacterium]